MRCLYAQSCASATLAAVVIVTLVATLIEPPKVASSQIIVSGAATRNSQRQQEAQETSANLMQMFNALSRQQQQQIIRQMKTSVASAAAANGGLTTPSTATVSQSTTPASPEVRVATAPFKLTTRAARTFLRATKSAPAPQVRPPPASQAFGKTRSVVAPPATAPQFFEAPKVVAAVKTVTKTPLRAQPPPPPPPLSPPLPAEPEVQQKPPPSKTTSIKRVTQTLTVVRPAPQPTPTPTPASTPSPTSEVPPPAPRIPKVPVAAKGTPPASPPPSIVELPKQQRIEDIASIEQQVSGGNSGVSFEDTGGELLAGGQLNGAGVSFGSLLGTVSGGYNGAPAPSSRQTPTPPRRVQNQLFEAQDAQQQQSHQRQQSLSRFEDLANWTAASINNKWYFMRPVDNPQELGLTSLAAVQIAGASEQVAVVAQLKTIPMTALLAINSVEPAPAATIITTNTTANNNNRATRATALVITEKPSTLAPSFEPTGSATPSQDVGSTNYDVTTASDGGSSDDDDEDAETRRTAVNDWRRRR